MAVLNVDSLTGCSSIPSFLGGTADTPANPSITIFHNTSAPTNWTKNTSASIDNIALRIIGGVEGVGISTGGSVPFSTVFSPKTSVISSSPTAAGISLSTNPSGAQASTSTNTDSALQSATLSVAELPSHTHGYSLNPGPAPASTSPGTTSGGAAAQSTFVSGSGGGPGTHNHSLSNPHTHPLTDAGHTHLINATGSHIHSFTLNQNFNISYVDVIIATKN